MSGCGPRRFSMARHHGGVRGFDLCGEKTRASLVVLGVGGQARYSNKRK